MRTKKFSIPLADVAIAVAIAGCLLAAAMPAYLEHKAASRRADAKSALLVAAGIVENHYTHHGTYIGATLGDAETISRHGHYVLSITSQDADGYRLLATRSGAQAGDKCGDFTYNQHGQIDVVSAANDKTKCL